MAWRDWEGCSASSSSSWPVQRVDVVGRTGVRRRAVDRRERGGQCRRPELQRRRQDARDRVPVVRGRQQLRRPDARRRAGRRGRRQRQADRVRREPDPATQIKQLQDATASGKYDAIITQPLYGAGLVEDVKKAIAAGINVGNIDQVLGSDMTTPNSQVEGLSANVAFVPSELGRKIGELVVAACADLKANPCNVGYIWSVKAAALDIALKEAFDKAIASHPEIKVVSDSGESFYTTALGLKASQDIVAAHPDVSVIVSADQAITGAVAAVKDIKDKVRLVGYGGGTIALQGIASGERFGTVMQMPATEGGLGTKQLINAIRTGTPAPGVDPLASLPDGGVVTKANVDYFLPLAEWPG